MLDARAMDHELETAAERARRVRAALGWPVDAGFADGTAPVARVAPDGRLRRWLLALAALIAGCDHSQGTVLWHAYNGAERDALEATAQTWNAEHPDKPLELVAVPYSAFADKLTSAIPGGNGPDLFIYPQDRIGDWADSGVIEPIEFWLDDAKVDRFSDPAVAAMAYSGSLYGLPLAAKSLVMYYRTDLVPVPPKTTDEIIAMVPALAERHIYPLAYSNVDLYGHAPWLFAFGGQVMGASGELEIATPQAARAMEFARDLVVKNVTPEHCDGPQTAQMVNEGKAALAISGPWVQADIAAGVPWKIAVLPTVSPTGLPATPFVGAEGVLMSARARDKDTAFAIMDALTGDAAAIVRAKRAGQLVPNKAAFDDPEIAHNELLATFRAQLAHTVPLTPDPAMRMVWTPYQTALTEVVAGRAEAGARLLGVQREVETYLRGARGSDAQ